MTHLQAWSRGRVAAVILFGGLAMAATLVAVSSAVSVRELHDIHADGTGLWEVAKIHVEGWNSPRFDPFADDRFRILTLLLTVGYLAAVTSLGTPLVAMLPGSGDWPTVVRILGGFLPGYLMVLAPLQLLFAAVPIPAASWVGVTGVLLAAAALHRRALIDLPARARAMGARAIALAGAGIAVAVALAALWRVQAGRNFMANDSVITWLEYARAELAAKGTVYLLQWDQQSDEWIFSAPLMFTSRAGQDYLFPIYAASAVGLASFACLAYGLVRTFAARRGGLASALAVAAVLAATPAIFPWFYISLFGGQNPAIWLGHPGRYIGILAPWVALLLVGRVRGRGDAVAVALATLGLGFLSVHVTVFVLVALGAVVVWRALAPLGPARAVRSAPSSAIIALGIAALFAPLVVYALVRRVSAPDALGLVLLAGALAGGVAFVLLGLSEPRRSGRVFGQGLLPVGLWLLTLVVGFALSNNLVDGFTGGGVRDVLATVLPGYDRALSSRDLLGETPISGLGFPTFTGFECELSGHCLSVGGFVASYGFITVMALAGWIVLSRTGDDETPRTQLRAAWLLCVSALAVAFAIVDFSGATSGVAWILTRFLEVPYYALLALAVIALVGARDRVTSVLAIMVTAVWIVIPLVVNEIPLQLVKNAEWLLGAVTP